jgi:hypothetical protein
MPHERLEKRSLALHRAIAEKLRRHPELVRIARENLDKWSTKPGQPLHHFAAWRALLDGPWEALLAAIQEDSPRMTELRQSSPFAGVLEARERWHVYDTFESGTHHSSSGNHR